jgi:hypothetical protein
MDIDDVRKQFPWLEKLPDFEEFFQETCHDCGAVLGQVHDLNCDCSALHLLWSTAHSV